MKAEWKVVQLGVESISITSNNSVNLVDLFSRGFLVCEEFDNRLLVFNVIPPIFLVNPLLFCSLQ